MNCYLVGIAKGFLSIQSKPNCMVQGPGSEIEIIAIKCQLTEILKLGKFSKPCFLVVRSYLGIEFGH